MYKLYEVILKLTSVCTMCLGTAISLWLAFYVMLFGGIMQAINNWGVDTSLVVLGIIMACFFGIAFVLIWPAIIGGVAIWGSARAFER